MKTVTLLPFATAALIMNFIIMLMSRLVAVMMSDSHLTPHTSHLTPHTSHLTPHTSHLIRHEPCSVQACRFLLHSTFAVIGEATPATLNSNQQISNPPRRGRRVHAPLLAPQTKTPNPHRKHQPVNPCCQELKLQSLGLSLKCFGALTCTSR
jgi:hypothetical protein